MNLAGTVTVGGPQAVLVYYNTICIRAEIVSVCPGEVILSGLPRVNYSAVITGRKTSQWICYVFILIPLVFAWLLS
jgi:hypothetical protein